ncbi:hypothetical protein D3C80_1855120 [compost metagenome]
MANISKNRPNRGYPDEYESLFLLAFLKAVKAMPSMIAASERNQSWDRMKAKLLPEKIRDHMVNPPCSSAEDESDHDDFIMFYL